MGVHQVAKPPGPLKGGLLSDIRFSKDFWKLPRAADGRQAILQDVLVINKADQTPAFLEYDTRIRPTSENYPLDDGLHILLIFTIPTAPGRGAGTFFTTLRKFDINKEMHYRSLVGEKFTIRVEPTHATQKFQEEYTP